jgi:hypothetical protein
MAIHRGDEDIPIEVVAELAVRLSDCGSQSERLSRVPATAQPSGLKPPASNMLRQPWLARGCPNVLSLAQRRVGRYWIRGVSLVVPDEWVPCGVVLAFPPALTSRVAGSIAHWTDHC